MSDLVVTPLAVRRRCLYYASLPTPTAVNDGAFGSALGQIIKVLTQYTPEGTEVTRVNRQLVQAFIFQPDDQPFRPMSATVLTAKQKNAIIKWVGMVHDDETGKWLHLSCYETAQNGVQL